MSIDNPCLTCGACCAYFRVSFYFGECVSAGGAVPDKPKPAQPTKNATPQFGGLGWIVKLVLDARALIFARKK